MRKLLRANFKRLFLSRQFLFTMAGLFCMGVAFTLIRYFDIQMNPEYYAELPDDYKCAEGFAFSGAYHIIFAVAVVIGSFVGTEFSDGTIRNKIIAGHTKEKIYLSELFTCAAASVMLLLIEMIAIFLVGKFVFTVSIMSVGQILLYAFSECVFMIALSAVLVFLMMLIANKAAGSVTVLLTVLLLLIAAMTIDDRIRQPEYYQWFEAKITYVDEETGVVTPIPEQINEKNPYYLEGTKRMIYEFLYDFLPSCQFMQVVWENSEKIPIMLGYSVLLCVVTTGGGLTLFSGKNLQ